VKQHAPDKQFTWSPDPSFPVWRIPGKQGLEDDLLHEEVRQHQGQSGRVEVQEPNGMPKMHAYLPASSFCIDPSESEEV
jgi:hypothetical protein